MKKDDDVDVNELCPVLLHLQDTRSFYIPLALCSTTNACVHNYALWKHLQLHYSGPYPIRKHCPDTLVVSISG